MSIKVNSLSFIYNKKDPLAYYALKDVNLSINDGDFVAIVGKTGSGKSTLVQMFNALLLPTDGNVFVDDFLVTSNKKERKTYLKSKNKVDKKYLKNQSNLRRKVGMVFQFPEYQLFSDTVLKDVMFGPKNFGFKEKEAKEKAIEALKSVQIPEEYYEKSPFELSGGEKRRVAIAGILASDPDILILDEPTAGLDPRGKKEIMELVKSFHEKNKTVILVTHDMDVVLEYATKVMVLKDAKIIKETTPEELFNIDDLSEYSLEVPTLYKFRNLLKNGGFAGNLENIRDFDGLISAILEVKK